MVQIPPPSSGYMYRDTLPQQKLSSVNVIHHTVLQLVNGTFRNAPSSTLYDFYHEIPLDSHCQLILLRFMARIGKLGRTLVRTARDSYIAPPYQSFSLIFRLHSVLVALNLKDQDLRELQLWRTILITIIDLWRERWKTTFSFKQLRSILEVPDGLSISTVSRKLEVAFLVSSVVTPVPHLRLPYTLPIICTAYHFPRPIPHILFEYSVSTSLRSPLLISSPYILSFDIPPSFIFYNSLSVLASSPARWLPSSG